MFTGLKAVNHFGRPDMSSFLKFVQKKHSYVSVNILPYYLNGCIINANVAMVTDNIIVFLRLLIARTYSMKIIIFLIHVLYISFIESTIKSIRFTFLFGCNQVKS